MIFNYNFHQHTLRRPLLSDNIRNNYPIIMGNSTDTNKITHPFPGIEIGIPLNIFQYVFTRLLYDKNIINLRTFIFQFATAYFTYGFDRLIDSYELKNITQNSSFINNSSQLILSDKKYELYKFIQNNEFFITNTIILAFFYDIDVLLSNEKTYPFIVILISTFFYKDFKIRYGILKPIYIGILWTISSIIIPCILYENNYKIFSHPEIYLPCFLTLFASSNLIDIKDIDEDKNNLIYTIPVKFGIKNSIIISYISILLSSYLIFNNENYNNNLIVNDIYLLQNIGLFFLPLSFNLTNISNN